MSARVDHPRAGLAVLLALITLLVVAACVLALAHTQTGARRSDRLRSAALVADRHADSVLALATAAVHAGQWRAVASPSQTLITHAQRSRDGELHASITRLGWNTLLVRGLATGRTGVPQVTARADHRLLVPLTPAVPMPRAALTGGAPWRRDPGAVLSWAAASSTELGCRGGVVVDSTRVDTSRQMLAVAVVTPLDPDTVSAPLQGVFRLIRDRISRPMVVKGMVESVTGLLLGADLQLAGVLVVQGSVQPAGGRLDVTGAVITRDSGGGRSVLGNGDRVRYDACAIRHAIARASRPAPAATWTLVGHF